MTHTPNTIIGCEIWLTRSHENWPNIFDNEIIPPSYKLYHTDRTRIDHYGGVLVRVRTSMVSQQIKYAYTSNFCKMNTLMCQELVLVLLITDEGNQACYLIKDLQLCSPSFA